MYFPKIIKYHRELAFWKKRFFKENGKFQNEWYQKWMLLMAEEKDDLFLKDKTIGDFGCGPRGSLEWVQSTDRKFGIDVLSEAYLDFNIHQSSMIYVTCNEAKIALPTGYLDVLFTLNALDHVQNLPLICEEILRVMKKGALLLGSFNMNEPFSLTEPQTLKEERMQSVLLKHFDIISEKRANLDKTLPGYQVLFSERIFNPERPYYYWVKAIKK